MSRDWGNEIDELKLQIAELKQTILIWGGRPMRNAGGTSLHESVDTETTASSGRIEAGQNMEGGRLYFSGYCRFPEPGFRWEPQERTVCELLEFDSEKMGKLLNALGHKQRLDILRTVLKRPMNGPELVEKLGMGTTGQLYHHIKSLQGAGLLIQEERGGTYRVPSGRMLPLLLMAAAAGELADVPGGLDMFEVRTQAGSYLGGEKANFDPHLLVWALLENVILEHRAGFASEVNVYLHGDRSITVADNGRGIPAHALASDEQKHVTSVLTEIGRPELSAPYYAPGGEKGISVSVVNAMSEHLGVEIRRDGSVYRQDFRHGIPQTALMTIGTTSETGTCITFQPDNGLFARGFDREAIRSRAGEIQQALPGLNIRVHG